MDVDTGIIVNGNADTLDGMPSVVTFSSCIHFQQASSVGVDLA